ncbi:MAG TPA: ABC transporter substrate-binding protein [Candidatus Binatia bacterium]
MTKSTPIAFTAGLCLIIACLLFSARVDAAEIAPKKITVAYTSYAPSVLWLLLEKELGFFRDEGFTPEFILVRGGGISVRGLIAGNFDYAYNTGAVIDAAIRTSHPLKVVFTAAMMDYWLVAQPEIRSVADLKGKTIGTGAPGSTTEITIREILKRHGLDPFKDSVFVGVGASQDRFAALTTGSVQATVLSPPFDFKATEMGYRKLVKASDYVRWPAGGIGTREDKILRAPEEVGKVVRASLKGLKFVATQRQYVLGKIAQMFRLGPKEAAQTYDGLREESIPSGYLNGEDERAVIAMMREAGNIAENIPPERIFDYRFVKQAEQDLKGWQPQIPRR